MSGVNGTPTFFIKGVRHEESFDLDTLSDAVESVIEAGERNHQGGARHNSL